MYFFEARKEHFCEFHTFIFSNIQRGKRNVNVNHPNMIYVFELIHVV